MQIQAPELSNESVVSSVDDVTGLLHRWLEGDADAASQALSWVYGDLRRLAASYVRRERVGHTLQATALVHEAYLRLFGDQGPRWRSREHFLAAAAKIMRHILVDHSRQRSSWKRGGREQHLTWTEGLVVGSAAAQRPADLVAVDDALRSLARIEPSEVELVELRFFAGLSLEQTARCLGVSRKTVVRRWRRVRAWLHAELRAGRASEIAGALTCKP